MFALPILALLITAVAGSAGMVAVLGWMLHRISRLEGGGPRDAGRLSAEAEAEELREQMSSLEAEVRRLRERVDFTEKLLEGPRRTPSPGTRPEEG